MEYLIGIDIGTSSVKVVAFSLEGAFLCKESKAYPLHSPQPTFKEQDPDLIFQSTLETCKAVIQQLKGKPIAFSLSSAMHSLLALDKNGEILTPLITWADNRATSIAKELKGQVEGQLIYQETGTPIHPMSPLCKLIWMQKQATEIFSKADKWIDIKSYILFKLFGQLKIDYSIASATGLFHLKKQTWHEAALIKAGIDTQKLPELVPTSYMLKGLKKHYANYWNISENIPFIVGASDGCLANLGAMSLKADHTVITIGTSAALRTTLKQPLQDQKGRIFNYWLEEDLFIVGGASNNGGILLEWYRNNFMPGITIAKMIEKVQLIPPGSEGLLFFPYLLGERAPLWDPAASGGFSGLTIQHQSAHFLRAIMEGLCFNLLLIGEALNELGYPIRQIYANGGFTKSEIWVQILANIFGKTVQIQGHQEGSAFGAVLIAMKALGIIRNYEEMKEAVQSKQMFTPNEDQAGLYQAAFDRFGEAFKSRF